MNEMEKLVTKFFRQKWQAFDRGIRKQMPTDPGVYVLAYTKTNLAGKTVNPKEVFYVGMTNARTGLKQRLSQFYAGINRGVAHSGGIRFFRDYLEGVPFEDVRSRENFWVAYLALPCKVKKSERTQDDLRTMGKVACLEYFVLAKIKKAKGEEPELNLK